MLQQHYVLQPFWESVLIAEDNCFIIPYHRISNFSRLFTVEFQKASHHSTSQLVAVYEQHYEFILGTHLVLILDIPKLLQNMQSMLVSNSLLCTAISFFSNDDCSKFSSFLLPLALQPCVGFSFLHDSFPFPFISD